MDTFEAVMMIEGDDDATPEQLIAAWQLLIDTGMVWQLQGFYGRTAAQLIEQGFCHTATTTTEKEA